MGKDLDINFKIQNYIKDLSKKLHPVQSEIISYNKSLGDIKKMQSHYVSKNLNNILLTTNKNLSFDKNFQGDFELKDNLLKKGDNKDFIYIGCQILNRKIFKKYKVKNFSISEIWNNLLSKDELNGFESKNKFYHLTDLEIFKKLKDL